jgi:hypothetical protein
VYKVWDLNLTLHKAFESTKDERPFCLDGQKCMSWVFEMTAMQRSVELSIALQRGQLVQRMLPRLPPPPGALATG